MDDDNQSENAASRGKYPRINRRIRLKNRPSRSTANRGTIGEEQRALRTADSGLPQGVHNLDTGTLPTSEDDVFTRNGKTGGGAGTQISVDIRHNKQDFESSDQALVSKNIQDFINDAEEMQPSKLSIVDEDLGGRRVMSISEEESKK